MNSNTFSNRNGLKRTLIILGSLLALLLMPVLDSFASMPGQSQSGDDGGTIISAYELHKLLTDRFGFISIKLSDAKYQLPDTAMLDQLKKSGSCGMQASGSVRDGWGDDDYAIAAMVPMRNYAFGTVFIETPGGEKKVLNIFVNSDREIVYWEAKSCRYYEGRLDKAEFMLF